MKIKNYVVVIFAMFVLGLSAFADEISLYSQSACLMEAESGEVLYEVNADEKLEPASVTKIMSLILVFEAMDEGKFDLDTQVFASEYASSMGGSQIWLEPGEQMSVNEMLKAVIVASANDCTVALAELTSGSEHAFVERMNEKAKELSMNNTHFENCTGLPIENHYTTARDIATMTRELHKHKKVYDYTKIWMDTLRGGEFGVTNTNKLIRFYNGATGMKTGFTSSALYCMSATAEKEGMSLIASVMKAETSDKRFSDAKKLLDYGFANYSVYTPEELNLEGIKVKGGKENTVRVECNTNKILIPKGKASKVEQKISVVNEIKAPFDKGTKMGVVEYLLDGKCIAKFDIVTSNSVEKITFYDLFVRMLKKAVTVR